MNSNSNMNQECTRLYPVPEKLEQPLRNSHFVVWIRACGSKIAYPSKRGRVLSFSGSQARLMWTGPSTQAEIQKDFNDTFNRKAMLDGDAYFKVSLTDVDRVYRQLLGKRHVHVPEKEDVDVHGRGVLRNALSAGHMNRLDAYDELRIDDRTCIADLDHWPGSPGDTSGPLFPVQLRHGHLYSFKKRRLCLGLEHLHAQGWNVFGDSCFETPLLPLFKSLKESAIKDLSGNGMHLPCIAAWYLYVMTHVVRLEDSKLLQEHRLSSAAVERATEEESHNEDIAVAVEHAPEMSDAEDVAVECAQEQPESERSGQDAGELWGEIASAEEQADEDVL